MDSVIIHQRLSIALETEFPPTSILDEIVLAAATRPIVGQLADFASVAR
jgi:hypothetical protein